MSTEAELIRERERYEQAAHRVQSAIAAIPQHPNQTPKHLRVGVDMGKSDQAGLAKLLIDKGVITMTEYFKAMADQAEIEAEQYETELSVQFGINIKTL
ncbi:hypothetical protein [Roseibium alexandrii]|uniref:hypothetical protein n=1 Tax=Roseibium alexandrii TaxID=388408 RepID=UPI003750DDD6